MPRLPFRLPASVTPILARSASLASWIQASKQTAAADMAESKPPNHSIRSYTPENPNGPFPYSRQDLTPMDPSPDTSFYSVPRFVTHIDDNAIINLTKYYDQCLPHTGPPNDSQPSKKVSILDLCSSWVSHYPPRIATSASKADGDLVVLGTGMNGAELSANPVLNPTPSSKGRDGEQAERRWWLQDLNSSPQILPPESVSARSQGENPAIDATTCVVSIDYLTSPVAVLESVRSLTKAGGSVHLVISNRCFPTKAVGRWLKVDEPKRLEMVGDYLWWSGWRQIEIVEVVPPGSWLKDPLWVVRATNPVPDT
jgi:hypothetical protein